MESFAFAADWVGVLRESARIALRHLAGFTAFGLVLLPPNSGLAQAPIDLVSLSTSGAQANGQCFDPAISSNGRKIAFQSSATNLDPGDTNFDSDIYVRDLDAGTTILASVDVNGMVGFWGGYNPSISGDGRFVAFVCLSPLVPPDSGFNDVFVRDLQTATTIRVSRPTSGGQPDGDSYPGTISTDGRYVAFLSQATNLVPGDVNGFVRDVFVWDRLSGAIRLEDKSSSGVQGNSQCLGVAISHDGRFVAFSSDADNLVSGDTNGRRDVFVRDRSNATTRRVSVSSLGLQGNGGSELGWLDFVPRALSADGRFVAFHSDATNLVAGDTNMARDIFVHDLLSAETTRINVATGGGQSSAFSDSYWYSITGDGRFVVFYTTATNLAPNDPANFDVYLRDRWNDETRWLSVGPSGQPGNSNSHRPTITPDGQHVSFSSFADNLVPGDTNGWHDIFVVSLGQWGPMMFCASQPNSLGCLPRISFLGHPSASSGSGFTIRGEQVIAGRPGLLLYGTSGPDSLPFQGGTLCAQPPLRRTPGQISAGTGPCAGTFVIDFAAFIAIGTDPALVAGQAVWAQWYSRDPQAALHTNLTDALYFVLRP